MFSSPSVRLDRVDHQLSSDVSYHDACNKPSHDQFTQHFTIKLYLYQVNLIPAPLEYKQYLFFQTMMFCQIFDMKILLYMKTVLLICINLPI